MGFRMPVTAVIFDGKLPHPLHVLPHDLQGIGKAVVSSDGIRTVRIHRGLSATFTH